MALIHRTPEGVALELAKTEVDLLAALPHELRAYFDVVTDPEDPVYQRLFPRAYLDPTEDQAEMAFTAFVRPTSDEDRLSALDAITVALEDAQPLPDGVIVHLDGEQLDAWARALNEVRLTLGVQLHMSDEHELDDLDPSDPRAPLASLYDWLSDIQGGLIEALLPAYENIPDDES